MTTKSYLFSRGAQAPRTPSPTESPNGATFDSGNSGKQAALNDSQNPTIRRHRRYGWRKPTGGRRRPGVIEATVHQLVRGIEHRAGGLYARLARLVPVVGYTRNRRAERRRSWRSDGAESVLGMLVALVYASDVRTGFIGRPTVGGGRWKRYTAADLATFAYQDGAGMQAADPATIRRAERALEALEHLGVLAPAQRIWVEHPDGRYTGEPAFRRLNWSRLAELASTGEHLKRDRKALDRKHGPSKPAGGAQPVAAADAPLKPSPAPQRARGAGRGGGLPQHVMDALRGLT